MMAKEKRRGKIGCRESDQRYWMLGICLLDGVLKKAGTEGMGVFDSGRGELEFIRMLFIIHGLPSLIFFTLRKRRTSSFLCLMCHPFQG